MIRNKLGGFLSQITIDCMKKKCLIQNFIEKEGTFSENLNRKKNHLVFYGNYFFSRCNRGDWELQLK